MVPLPNKRVGRHTFKPDGRASIGYERKVTNWGNQMCHLFTAMVCILLLGNSAIAREATCADYSRAKGEDRALFNAFIFGFVIAKIGERGDAEVNTATARVKELADRY